MQMVLDACRAVPVARIAAGEILIREGDRTGQLYVLVEGSVGVVKGGVQVARVDNAGALLGEMSVLLDMPHSATVIALTDAKVHVIADAEGFLESTPGLALHSARVLAQRLHDATTYLADLKAQYEGTQGHFGMIDRILDSLMNQPKDEQSAVAARKDDPRL